MLLFLRGDGFDEPSLVRALEMEDHKSFTPTVLKPSVVHALILAWTGELDRSHEQCAIQRRCVEKGEEGELIFIDFQVVLNRIWRGDLAEAERVSEAAMELASQLGGDFPSCWVWSSGHGSRSIAVRRTPALPSLTRSTPVNAAAPGGTWIGR